jgi:hypothetical protein
MSLRAAGASNIIFIPPMGSNDVAPTDAQLMALAKPSLHFFAKPTRHLSFIAPPMPRRAQHGYVNALS